MFNKLFFGETNNNELFKVSLEHDYALEVFFLLLLLFFPRVRSVVHNVIIKAVQTALGATHNGPG